MISSFKKNQVPMPWTKQETWPMFNSISRTYDAVNSALSLGIHTSWRRKLAHSIPPLQSIRVLDLATGTGDQLLEVLKFHGDRVTRAVGVDPASQMLALAQLKRLPASVLITPEWICAKAEELPFPDSEFDVVTMTFGIRNTTDPRAVLQEIRRVLKPGGLLRILEFSIPKSKIISLVYLFYFRNILPIVGGILSGNPAAYRYLNRSVEAFPQREQFVQILFDEKFVNPYYRPLTFGVATLYGGMACKEGV